MQPDEANVCDACGASLEEVSKTVTLSLMQAVIAYQAGDNSAFQTIYDETEKNIYASILKVVGSFVNAQAMIEDIMKATYMEIGRSLGQLERPETFVDWANRIATRNCFAFLNANQPNPYWYDIPYGMAEQQVGERILPNTIEQDIAVQNSVRLIMAQQFTSMEKFCVVSHYYNGIEIEELSQSIGVPSQAIIRNLNSAKTKLCKTLMATEKDKSTGMSDLGPWIDTLFKQDIERIDVPRRIHDMIKNAIAGVMLGMPGTLTSGVVLTGAVQATGSITVNSALAGTGLSSIAGTTLGGTVMGSAAMGGTSMGGAATGGTVMGAAANTGAGVSAGTAASANAIGTGAASASGAISTGATSASGAVSTGATSASGTISTGATSASGAISAGATGAGATSAGGTVATGVATSCDVLGGAATAGAAAGGAGAGTAAGGIFATLGAKIAVAVAGAAVVTGGGIAIHHAVTSNDKDELVVEQMSDDEDNHLYRIQCDDARTPYVYESGNHFGELRIEGDKYKALAKTLENAQKKFKENVESKTEYHNTFAEEYGYDEAVYCVSFKVARADENVFSCIVKETWNTYTDVTMWEPFVTIDAKTGEILELDDVCDVTELKSYVMDNMDDGLDHITEYFDYPGGDPSRIKERQAELWKTDGVKWFLSAEGVCVDICDGCPVESGDWTMIVPYEEIKSFKKQYLPKGAMSCDMSCDIGLMPIPLAFKFDTDGDGIKEAYGENGEFREVGTYYYNGHRCYFVRNDEGQCFFVVPGVDDQQCNGTEIYLVTPEVQFDKTNAIASELNICSISGDIAYCYNFVTGKYGYYQITDQGLLPWDENLKNHKYELVEDQVTWEEAKALAEQRGGHLATITSEAEQIYVESISNGVRCWIGAYCDENYENWRWITDEPWDYTNWAEGEPSRHGVIDGERYATIWPREWNDLANESVEQSGYIIEWD